MFKRIIGKGVWLLGMAGFDVHKFFGYRHLPRFFREYRSFVRAGGLVAELSPQLLDYGAPAGMAQGAYFHQDLLVATFVHKSNPVRHIDVGSRIDGFVAHVASFRTIEVMDVREVAVPVGNIQFILADLMRLDPKWHEIADSVSCLHAIEHFGLGRYGDPISPDGHVKGFENIWHMLKPGGTLYISFPIASKASVAFNAHRVFAPMDLFSWTSHPLELIRFDFVDDEGALHENHPLGHDTPKATYGCGIYTLRKPDRSE